MHDRDSIIELYTILIPFMKGQHIRTGFTGYFKKLKTPPFSCHNTTFTLHKNCVMCVSAGNGSPNFHFQTIVNWTHLKVVFCSLGQASLTV
jgi:hypothetical protein